MTKNKNILIGGMLALGALAVFASHAEERRATTADKASAAEQKIAESLKKLVFVPHDQGAPAVTDAGGVRAVAVLPKVELLAPERMARTLSPTPTLYWHVTKPPVGEVRFTLLADRPSAIDPLLEFAVDGVDQEGIYGISLGDHGLALESGQRYIWSIALSAEGDGYSSDRVAQTVMQHAPDPALAKALDGALAEARAIRLAAEGYWYDAIDVLSAEIEGDAAAPWRAARARLLDQAGLMRAARYDRERAGADAGRR